MNFTRLLFTIVSGILLFTSCGGGGGGGGSSSDVGCFINTGIDRPTYLDTWTTGASTIDLGGLLPTPGDNTFGSTCPDVTGYFNITWHNELTNESGTGGAWSWLVTGILGSYCDTRWFIYGVPLSVGNNKITVSMWDINGCTGEDSITITRTAP